MFFSYKFYSRNKPVTGVFDVLEICLVLYEMKIRIFHYSVLNKAQDYCLNNNNLLITYE